MGVCSGLRSTFKTAVKILPGPAVEEGLSWVARLDVCQMIKEPKQSMRRGSSLKTSKLQDPDVELPAEMH